MTGQYGTKYTFERLAMCDNGGYDWSVVAAYKRSDGAFAVVQQSGCSCTWFEEGEALEDAEWFYSVTELYRRFDTAIDQDYNVSKAESAEAKAELRRNVH